MPNKLIIFLIVFIITSNTANPETTEISDSTKHAITISQINKNLNLIENNLIFENDSFLILAKNTLSLSNEIRYTEGIFNSYYNIAQIFRHRNSNDSAIFYFEKSLEQEIHNFDDKARSYWHIATMYKITGNYSLALECSLKLKELIESGKTNIFSYQVYNMLALTYQALMEYELAKEYYVKSSVLALKNNNEAYAGVVYANIGKLLYIQDSLTEALQFYNKGVALEEKHGLLGNVGNSYTTIARIYMKMNMLDTAKALLVKASKYQQKSNNKVGITNTLYTISEYHYLKNDLDHSLNHINETITYAKELNFRSILSKAYKLRSEIYSKQNKHQQALDDYQKFFDIYSSIYDVEKISKAKAIEQKLLQQERENKIVELDLKKQKSINSLLIVISILVAIVIIIVLIYLSHYKKLTKALTKSKNKAEESDQLKSKFLQTISHEIRTPLNGIIGFSEMLSTNEIDKNELPQINEMIQKNSDDLISTIENLVDVAHLTTSQHKVHKSSFEVKPILDSIKYQIEHYVVFRNKKELSIQVENNTDIEVLSDKNILLKILTHLAKNAVLYTEKGVITLGYKTNGSDVVIYVKDTGIGIPKDKIDVIFSPFRCADQNVNIKVGGTGLGLTIVNGFIQILDGKIWVDSEIDKGSTFYISIPLN